jgi:hypothetical protein
LSRKGGGRGGRGEKRGRKVTRTHQLDVDIVVMYLLLTLLLITLVVAPLLHSTTPHISRAPAPLRLRLVTHHTLDTQKKF